MKTELLISLSAVLVAALCVHWAAVPRRAGTWFGVTVPCNFQSSATARRLLARYRAAVWVVAVAAALCLLAAGFLGAGPAISWMFPFAPLAPIAAGMLAFLNARRGVLPLALSPSGIRSASLLASPEGLPGGPAAILAPFGILGAAALYMRANWQRLPDRFPVHWGIDGHPDAWAGRDWHGAYGMLIAGVMLVALLLVLAEAILRGSPAGRGVDPEWTARFRHANLRALLAATWGLSCLFSLFSVSPFLMHGDTLPVGRVMAAVAVFLAVIFAFIWPVIRISQEPDSPNDATPDECWKLGAIYYNPRDPALLVSKRFGIGYSLNFGNRVTWALVAMLLLFIFGMVAVAAELPGVSGDWLGKLYANGVELRLVIHLQQTGEDALAGTLDSVDQGAKAIRLQHIRFTNGKLSLEMGSGQASFAGRLDPAKGSITGFWNQGGASMPLTLRRVTAPVVLDRPQEPKPPFPYVAEDVAYDNPQAEGVRLAGTFTHPRSGGPFPAVLLIAGSGRHGRNEEVFGHKPFLVLADALTRRGIAVLRFDKRGVGGSKGDYASATSQDFASDAMAGVRYLFSRPDVDKKRIGLIGHSEGGMIAPMVAAKMPEVAFAVLLAGGGVPGSRLLPQQVYRLDLAAGLPEPAAAEAREEESKVLALVAGASSDADLRRKLHALAANPSAEKALDRQVGAMMSPWFRFFISFDPATALAQVKCPVLALDGGKDAQVDANQNLPAIRAALEKAGNRNVTTEVLPGLNHLFQDCRTGAVSEYGQIEETMSPKVIELVGDWITHGFAP